MKVKEKSITEFLEGRKETFLIPVYQRNYDWEREHCEVLWQDLEAASDVAHPHFFGSIVRVRDGDDNIIIDGQQRLTTVSLLMLAIAHRMEVLGLEKPDLREVMDLYQNGKRQPKLKLKLLREDMQAYECVVDHTRDCVRFSKSKIIKNYEFFHKKLDAENIERIFNATKKLVVIDVLLESDDDNPQAVFESLNDKGEKLNDADKIRNFILMNFDYEKQCQLYDDYWTGIEKNAGLDSKDTTKYIWRYIQYKTNNKTGDKYIYSDFRNYIQNKDKEQVLENMYFVSEIYNKIILNKVVGVNAEQINKYLDFLLNDLKMQTALPLLLDVIEQYEAGNISGHDVVDILKVLISYIVRRGLVGMPNMIYNGFFLVNKKVHYLLDKFPNGTYLDVIKYIIYNAKNREENPSDVVILDNAVNTGVYNKNSTICRYILIQMEKDLMKKNDPNSQHILNENVLSIEHVMPQTLSGFNGDNWKEELGNDWQTVHEKYLHTIGNLTLTAYNANLSNSSFTRKKQELSNYAPLYLNQYLMESDTWNADKIFERSNIMARHILELWPIYKPENEYIVHENSNKLTLDNMRLSDIVLKRKPKQVELYFMDITLDVANWRDLYSLVIKELYNNAEYRAKMQRAFEMADISDVFNEIISNSPQIYGKSGAKLWEQIIPDNDVYFKTTKSSSDICIALKAWLKYLDIDPSDVEITLK